MPRATSSPGISPSFGTVLSRDIARELEESYLDYAMSVIVARALPDVRDGLKPVHRRILFAMHDLGLGSRSRFRKSAAIVGEVLGKYHPHGDAPVYDALVRMAQDFSLRYPLIGGQGNFGSIDGDAPAAMRYSEARLSPLAEELLKDIEKETVDFQENYDGTRREPKVLPASLPQLLVNGTVGIAVGMSSYIPPHNLAEVLLALVALSDNPSLEEHRLVELIPGPDFPTGGIIYGKRSLKELYERGRGSFTLRGVATLEEEARRANIVISEIPFQVQKSALIESIAELVESKKLEGVRDVRDESDREGMRVVLELRPDAEPQKILNNLFRFTDLQKQVHASFLALVEGIQPRVLTLREILLEFLKHRKEVVTRRARFDLTRAQERAHILEGLTKALEHIDEVIATIKRSDSREEAARSLITRFDLSATQAQAILEMRLATLAKLEREKLEEELNTKRGLIHELTLLLKDPKLVREAVRKELEELRGRYQQDRRRTKIIFEEAKVFQEEDLIPEEETIVVLTEGGYIKRLKPELIKQSRRGGRGVVGMETKEEDAAAALISSTTHDRIFFASERGRIFCVRAWEIPEGGRATKGKLLRGLLPLAEDEKIAVVLAQHEKERREKFLVLVSEQGIIKKTDVEEFSNVRRNGIRALGLKEDDRLSFASFSSGEDEVMIASSQGKVLRFREKDLRALSRGASGVTGIQLNGENRVIGMGIVPKGAIDALTFTVSELGFAKKTYVKHYRLQRRGGVGVKTVRISESSGKLSCFTVLNPELAEAILLSEKGQIIRIPIASIPILSRTTRGVRVMKLGPGDKMSGVTFL